MADWQKGTSNYDLFGAFLATSCGSRTDFELHHADRDTFRLHLFPIAFSES